MNCEQIDEMLSGLKVSKNGRLLGKSKAVDKIHSEHLKNIDSALTEVRVFIAQLSYTRNSKETIEMIDKFIYEKQIK